MINASVFAAVSIRPVIPTHTGSLWVDCIKAKTNIHWYLPVRIRLDQMTQGDRHWLLYCISSIISLRPSLYFYGFPVLLTVKWQKHSLDTLSSANLIKADTDEKDLIPPICLEMWSQC